jgi:hypothetical protein
MISGNLTFFIKFPRYSISSRTPTPFPFPLTTKNRMLSHPVPLEIVGVINHQSFNGTQSTCPISLWNKVVESPVSHFIVTPVQSTALTVPLSVAVPCQQTRSPTLRSRDWWPVMYATVTWALTEIIKVRATAVKLSIMHQYDVHIADVHAIQHFSANLIKPILYHDRDHASRKNLNRFRHDCRIAAHCLAPMCFTLLAGANSMPASSRARRSYAK